jgi:hypothetical protein
MQPQTVCRTCQLNLSTSQLMLWEVCEAERRGEERGGGERERREINLIVLGGDDGLDFVREILNQTAKLKAPEKSSNFSLGIHPLFLPSPNRPPLLLPPP